MRANPIVISLIRLEQVNKVPLAKHHDIVHAFPPDRADQPFSIKAHAARRARFRLVAPAISLRADGWRVGVSHPDQKIKGRVLGRHDRYRRGKQQLRRRRQTTRSRWLGHLRRHPLRRQSGRAVRCSCSSSFSCWICRADHSAIDTETFDVMRITACRISNRPISRLRDHFPRQMLAVPSIPIDAIKATATKPDEPKTPEHPCHCCGGRMICHRDLRARVPPETRTHRLRRQIGSTPHDAVTVEQRPLRHSRFRWLAAGREPSSRRSYRSAARLPPTLVPHRPRRLFIRPTAPVPPGKAITATAALAYHAARPRPQIP